MAQRPTANLHIQLPGEDPDTSVLPEVAGWIAIYEQLAGVLRLVLERSDGTPESEGLRGTLTWLEGRLDAWRDRHAELAGVAINSAERTIVHGGRSTRLTRREAELLEFLLRHPNRPYTGKQLASLAWSNSYLSEAQVRTYIMRLRQRLRDIGLERLITVTRNLGYRIAPTGAAEPAKT